VVATYLNDGQGPHYRLADWLGTTRVQVNSAGVAELTCASLPFGDPQVPCTSPSATEQFFTGQERDQETGNDYFQARYYASSMGRFLSPDWTEDPSAIPYGDTSNPQSFNLYSYAGNNPVANSDDDGHDCIYNNGDGSGYVLRGDCASDTDSGIYVNGTVDVNSFQYNASNNSSTFTYTPDSGANIGVGTIQGPNLNGGFDPGSLGAAVFGAQNASTWNNAAGVVNAAGGLEASIMAPWAVAAAQCSGQSKGACAANMAFALLPFGLEGAAAKDLKAISGVLKMVDSGTTKGKVFMNLESKLPAAAEGYYREFTVPLAGQSGRGASRIVTGANGEAYYTADHYTTFTRIR
jgi:RHS repeat-associated protein